MHFLRSLAVASVFASAALAQVVAYHNVTAASHQTQFTTLSNQGYRLTQLAVAGGLSAPRYSAIWEQAAGPAWVSMSGLTPTQYVAQRTTWLAQGYRPKLITAAGAGADAVVATMFVADGQSFADYVGISETTLNTHCATQRANGRRPVSADIYGTSATPLYTVVFEPNPDDTPWGCIVDATPSEFAETFNAFYEADARIGALGMAEDQRHVSVWYDDRVGAWAARSNLTSSGWQTEFTTLTNAGYSPLVIASGGVGASLRFAGAFGQYRTPRARVLTKTGLARSEFAAIDTYMTNHVQTTGARNAVIAISRHGKLVYTRGYTWAEPVTLITQPTSLFRLASLTKPLTAMAVQKLVANGTTSLSSRPATILGITGTSQYNNASLLHCLEYTSGMRRDFSDLGAATLANPGSPVFPLTPAQATAWTTTQFPLFAPGAAGNYSNTAYMVAGHVVEHLTGQTLPSWLQTNVYGPLGITRFRVAAGLPQNLHPTEIRGYVQTLRLEPSTFYTDQRRKAQQWSWDPQIKRGSGGMAGSAVDCVRLLSGVFGLGADWITHPPAQVGSMLARHTVTPFPGADGLDQVTPGGFSWTTRSNGVHAYHKGGTLTDCGTSMDWRSDGIAIAAFVSKGSSAVSPSTLHQLVEGVTSWPNDDLFPSYGLPSFAMRPELTSANTATLPNVTNTPFVVTGLRLDTVTQVNLGPHVIVDTTPANWHLGWFRVVSPTQMEVYPPQGITPSSLLGLTATNPAGTSGGLFTGIYADPSGLAVSAPPTVTPSQSFRVYCGRGSLPTPSFGVLTISTSNQPSVAPGVIDLGIGNQFSDLLVADFQLFDPTTSCTWWTLPPLPWPGIYVQTAGFDPASAVPLPLPTSSVRQVIRTP